MRETGRRPSQGSVVSRLHWIDWLRVAAIAGVFLFHSLRPFNVDDWHVKNVEQSADLGTAMSVFVILMSVGVFLGTDEQVGVAR